ncbi:MAG: DUF2789 domain-containing protein [Parashewanella sp.]
MESPIHSVSALFEQLGLNSSTQKIDEFISQNSPIPSHVELFHASCWTPSQASFLKQMKEEDADWTVVVDQLDARLRSK